MAVTYDVVLQFDRNEEGALKPGLPKKTPDAGSAERRGGISHHNWCRRMTFSRIVLIAVAVVAMAAGVGQVANADDAARIKQCVAGNKGEGETATVVAAYFSCMNKEDARLGDAVDHHLGEFASRRAKGLLRGNGREAHIEVADCCAPAGLAGTPIA